MKLTKGRINKLLKMHRHTVKHIKHNVTSTTYSHKSRNNFTIKSSKRPLNLANKTLHHYK